MLQAAQKYDAFPPIQISKRKWPDKTLKKPPRWLATDLRDGNQALPEPMGGDAKLYYFQTLVRLGYKEIEISYPSASQTEFDFTRHLATTPNLVPDDVWVQVMAPCREELIRKTIESVRGMKKVIVHLHVSTSECFRRIVFNKTEQQMIDLVVRCTKLLRDLTKDSTDPEFSQTQWIFEFTPENFQDTTLDYAVKICEAAKSIWEPTEESQIIFNLPSTVEVAMPNVFADQIETFCERITDREKVCVSLHTHNDRGSAVAAAELAQLAGADRVEGCLFGNGERTGNVDLVTLALNLFTHGVDPGIDFGDINQVSTMVEELTKIPIHWRAPYAGKYTFCTFTGTHQDAIRKGYKRRRREIKPGDIRKWEMPYLPMDPEDLGRKHEAIIRVNSQSGKSGIAWLVQQEFDIDMPLGLELDFTQVVQNHATATGIEVSRSMIREKFEKNYMLVHGCGLKLMGSNCTAGGTDSHGCISNASGTIANDNLSCRVNPKKRKIAAISSNGKNGNGNVVLNDTTNALIVSLQATVDVNKMRHDIQGQGLDLATAALEAVRQLGFSVEINDHSTAKCGLGPDTPSQNVSFVQLGAGKKSTSWGVGIHEDASTAFIQATLRSWWNLNLKTGAQP